jgi:hypothetical protein
VIRMLSMLLPQGKTSVSDNQFAGWGAIGRVNSPSRSK